jgi:peptidyl-prolyl cis-trans isomerase SurA
MNRTFRRRAAAVTALAAALTIAPAAAQQAGTSRIIERVIVKVNGEILTQTELETRQIEAVREKNPQLQDPKSLPDDALRAQLAEVTPAILAQAVDDLLILQRGRELGFTMNDEQFKRLVENVKTENKLNDEQLTAALAGEGMTMAQWRAMAERQVIVQGVQQREIMSKTTLTDSEMRTFYEAHRNEFLTPATVTLREVFLAVATSTQGGQTVFNVGQEEAVKARIEAARARLLKGEDAAAVVAEVSESGSKANGGLVGPVNLSEVDPALKPVLENLKPGDVSEPLRTAKGFVIFKLESRTEAVPQPFAAVRDQIYQRIMGERVDGETRKYLDTIRGAALIEWKDESMRKLYEIGLQKRSAGGRP